MTDVEKIVEILNGEALECGDGGIYDPAGCAQRILDALTAPPRPDHAGGVSEDAKRAYERLALEIEQAAARRPLARISEDRLKMAAHVIREFAGTAPAQAPDKAGGVLPQEIRDLHRDRQRAQSMFDDGEGSWSEVVAAEYRLDMARKQWVGQLLSTPAPAGDVPGEAPPVPADREGGR